MSSLREATAAAFLDGPLETIEGYRVRERQVSMALSVASAIEEGGIHLFEAGTGTGKSLAYLVPAMLQGASRVFLSTATKTLQDQLFERDIPDLGRALGIEPGAAILKGRRNYLCLRKLGVQPGGLVEDALAVWADGTTTGDVSELPSELGQEALSRITSDSADCLAQKCPRRSQCFFMKARAEARRAHLLVLNHHLLVTALLSDEMLPEAGILVADEGHRLEDAASECLGWSLTQGAMLPVFDGIACSGADPDEVIPLLDRARALLGCLELLLPGVPEAVRWDLEENREKLDGVAREARGLAGAMPGERLEPARRAVEAIASSAEGILGADREENCLFLEGPGRSCRLRAAPLEPGRELAAQVYSHFDSVVLTSATLTVAGSFSYSAKRLGAPDASAAEDFGSPFDFGNQAVLLVPGDLPGPDEHEALARCAWDWAGRFAGILGGRTMVLFTSLRNLNLTAAEALRRPIPGLGLHVQGMQSKSAILERFRADPGGIILGTATFWEGVDLPGQLLQAVIIDRLPFPSPGHPLTAARLERIEGVGGNPFMELTLPSAVIRLRQGVGRLLRSETDRGVVAILDRRARTAAYGRLILGSLPAFRQVCEEDALAFACGCRREV